MVFEWWAARRERRISEQANHEISEFFAALKGLDATELALVAAQTADASSRLSAMGFDMSKPTLISMRSPTLVVTLTGIMLKLQQDGKSHLAPGWFVWCHTLRSEQRPALRYLAKQIWALVERGFEDAELAAFEFETATGTHLNVEEKYLCIPAGYRLGA